MAIVSEEGTFLDTAGMSTMGPSLINAMSRALATSIQQHQYGSPLSAQIPGRGLQMAILLAND